MNDLNSTLISRGNHLASLAQIITELLPCDAALITEQNSPDSPPVLLASAGLKNTPDLAALAAQIATSRHQVSAEGGTHSGVFIKAFRGFRTWVMKPVGEDGADTVRLICLRASEQPFETSELIRLAAFALPGPHEHTPAPRPGTAHAPSGMKALTRYLDTHITSTGISSTSPLALLRIDLGRIGPINDSDGWPVSDALIERASHLLRDIAPPPCFTVHLGAGSFAIALPVDQDVEQAEILAATLIDRMNDARSRPENGFPLEPYIGWAAYPFDAPDTDTLIGFANAALARIRGMRAGPYVNRVAPEIAHAHSEQLGMETDLRKAIAEGAFTLNWLPVLETGTEHVIAFEALVRWRREGHGDIDASAFLSCAENAGLIEDIDRWVLRNACAQAQAWTQPLGLSVNVSPSWLETERVAATIGEALAETGLDPARLQIELSEQRSFGCPDSARKELARIRAMGVRLVLDDFGTGYGSLERLTNYPFDQVKLDRMFIRRLNTDSRVETVLRSTLHLIHSLNMTCCAEGVETEEQLGFLNAHGCEEIQGYLIGHPTIRLPEPR